VVRELLQFQRFTPISRRQFQIDGPLAETAIFSQFEKVAVAVFPSTAAISRGRRMSPLPSSIFTPLE
jgi:hypothetical protein